MLGFINIRFSKCGRRTNYILYRRDGRSGFRVTTRLRYSTYSRVTRLPDLNDGSWQAASGVWRVAPAQKTNEKKTRRLLMEEVDADIRGSWLWSFTPVFVSV